MARKAELLNSDNRQCTIEEVMYQSALINALAGRQKSKTISTPSTSFRRHTFFSRRRIGIATRANPAFFRQTQPVKGKIAPEKAHPKTCQAPHSKNIPQLLSFQRLPPHPKLHKMHLDKRTIEDMDRKSAKDGADFTKGCNQPRRNHPIAPGITTE